jgi:hypothetical protein
VRDGEVAKLRSSYISSLKQYDSGLTGTGQGQRNRMHLPLQGYVETVPLSSCHKVESSIVHGRKGSSNSKQGSETKRARDRTLACRDSNILEIPILIEQSPVRLDTEELSG